MPMRKTGLKRWTEWLKSNRLPAVGFFAVFLFFFAAYPTEATDVGDVIATGASAIFGLLTFFLAFILNVITYAVGKLIVLLLGMVIIPILGYNGFGDSNIIDIGWPLVRDVVNMFVIVVLLVIAIKTIIGSPDANWQQQLPRLFLAIIAVNFSRTITLLIIDIGQVVMFTFVNALRDIAAGNFVNMFQLTKIFEQNVDNIESVNAFEAGATALNNIGYLATSYVTLVFTIAILAVLILLSIVFIYRIVVLWVLVILSPAAMFLGGIKSILPRAGSAYGQWWEKLVGAVALGPILTFFLWLALAAAAEGSIATSEGFSTEATDDVPTFLSEALGIEQMLSLFIAMVLIMAGFQAASQSASALGGFSGKLINEGTGKKLVSNAAKLPATAAYRAGRGAARAGIAGGRLAGRQFLASERGQGFARDIGRGIQQVGSDLESSGVIGGRAAGRLVRGLGGRVEGGAAGVVDKAREVGAEKAAAKTRRERMQDMMNIGDPNDTFLLSDRYEQEANFQALLSDKGMRKELKSVAEETAKREALDREFDNDDEREAWIKQRQGQIIDDKMQAAFDWAEGDGAGVMGDKSDELKKARAGHLRSLGGQQEISDFLQEMGDDFKLSMLSEEDMQNDDVLQALAGHTMREYTDRFGNVIRESALDQAAAGKGGVGAKVRNAARGQGVNFDNLVEYAGTDDAGERIRVEGGTAVGQALRNGHVKLKDLTVDHLSARDAAGNIMTDAAGDNILDDNKIAVLARAIAESRSDAGDIDQLAAANPEAYRRVMEQLQNGADAAETAGNKEEELKYRKAMLSADQGAGAAGRAGIVAGSLPNQDLKKLVQEMVVEQPTQVLKFEAQINSEPGATDLTSAIARNVNSQTARNMQNLLNQALAQGDDALAQRIRDSARTIAAALEKQHAGQAGNNPRQGDIRRFQQLERYT